MAEAILLLERGITDPNKPTRDGWQPLFHIDVKLANILLGDPERHPEDDGYNWHAHYPKPLFADFGGAMEYPQATREDQIPREAQGAGTEGFSPFVSLEQHRL